MVSTPISSNFGGRNVKSARNRQGHIILVDYPICIENQLVYGATLNMQFSD